MSNWPFEFAFQVNDELETEDEYRRRGGRSRTFPSSPPPIPPTRYRRRSRIYAPAVTPVVSYLAPPSDLLIVQERLAEILGMEIPATGQWSALTRRALRLLQRRSRLPVTGRLDRATRLTLFAAPAIAAPAPPPPDEPEPSPYPTEPQQDPPSDPPAPGPEEPSEEPPEELQQEIHLSKGCTAILERSVAQNAAAVYDGVASLPPDPGLYVIRKAGKPIYVGIAEISIHSRFQQRYKALRDFGLDSTILSGITVTSYALKSRTPTCIATRRPMRGGRPVPITAKEGLLRILEQHFIRHFRTGKRLRSKFGNSGSERYTFGPGEQVRLRLTNAAQDDPPGVLTPAVTLPSRPA